MKTDQLFNTISGWEIAKFVMGKLEKLPNLVRDIGNIAKI